MKKSFYIVFSVLLFFASESAIAQMSRKSIKKNNKRISSYRGKKEWFGKEKRYQTLGISLNALNYYGDLAPKPNKFSTDITFTRPAIGLSYSHRFGPRYSIVGSFMYGTLKGADSESADENDLDNGLYRYQRNLSFRNRIKELSLVASFDLFSNMHTYISRVKWTPYAFAGVAGFLHNPQAQVPETDLKGNPLPNGGEWVNLQSLGTEGQHATLLETDVNSGIKPYKKLQIAIPFGFGVRFRLNEMLDLSAELGFRYLFTDYIDDVSTSYIDPALFNNYLPADQVVIAQQMMYRENFYNPSINRPYINTQRGDPTENDAFFSGILRFGWRINSAEDRLAKKQMRCPVFY